MRFWHLFLDRLFLAAVLFCAALMGFAGWMLFKLGPPPKKPTKAGYTHLHCPVCNAEYPYTPVLDGQPCTDCEAEAALVPTIGSIRLGEVAPRRFWGNVVVMTLLAGVLVPLLLLFAASRRRSLTRTAEEFEHRRLVWYCPYCQGKISYPISKVGTGVLCSRCKTAFTLAPPEDEDAPG